MIQLCVSASLLLDLARADAPVGDGFVQKLFSDFTTFSGPPRSVVHLSDLAPGGPPPADPDFEEAALNVNVVLRWEYRVGSTLFLVYSRSQTPSLALEPGQVPVLDVGAALRAPAADVFLTKLTYWWG
jgi:hypothetical protein